MAEIAEDFIHLVDKCGVTRQLLDFLIRNNQPANCLGEVDQQRRVPDVIFGDLGLIVSVLFKVLGSVRAENGQANDRVADQNRAIFDKH